MDGKLTLVMAPSFGVCGVMAATFGGDDAAVIVID